MKPREIILVLWGALALVVPVRAETTAAVPGTNGVAAADANRDSAPQGRSAPPSLSPARALRDGVRCLERGDAAAAVKSFRTAGDSARERKEPKWAPRAAYDEGVALLQQGDSAGAEDRWMAAASLGGDPAASQRAMYNLGCLKLTRAQTAYDKNEGPSARSLWQQAAVHFSSALLTGMTSEDPKYNLEYARYRVDALDALVRKAEDILKKTDALLDEGRFEEAQKTMAGLPKERELIYSLKSDVKATVERLEQRLAQVIEIRNPSKKGGV